MKVLIVSTLKRRIASDIFASRSRIIFQLARGLAGKGHKVSLLGTADSEIPGVEIIPVIDKGWVDLPGIENPFVRDVGMLTQLLSKLRTLHKEFDVIHSHTYPDFFPSIIEGELSTPLIATLHAVMDSYLDETLSAFTKTYFVALSESYKRNCKKTNIYKVVYNGVDTDLYSFSDKKEDYLFWLGRLPKSKNDDGSFIDPKGVRWAIRLAKETGQKLFLSGVVEDRDFFEKDVKPYLGKSIQWVGEVSSEQTLPVEKVVELMKGAKAFLMTINQSEPFGLVMAEAMSCGTPVIAFDHGSVSEVVIDGKTGFIVSAEDGIEGLKQALNNIKTIQPRSCRRHIEENFTINKMISNYEDLYKKLIGV